MPCAGDNIETIQYLVRSDKDNLNCSVLQPAEHSDDGLQDEQGPAKPVLMAPEHNFPLEIWAAFFQERSEDLKSALQQFQ